MRNLVKNYNLKVVLIALAIFLFQSQLAIADLYDRETEDNTVSQYLFLKLTTNKFDELEKILKIYLDLYLTDLIPLDTLYSKFSAFKTPGIDQYYNAWINAYPKSYSARLARGVYRYNVAYEKRGTNFSDKTTDGQFQDFEKILKESKSDLEESLRLYERPVLTYCYLLQISSRLNLNSERKLLDAALKLDQKAYNLRSAYLNSITPKWGGNDKLMKEFMDENNKSPLSDYVKKILVSEYYYYLAEQEGLNRNYKSASDLYLNAYKASNSPGYLRASGNLAFDGGFKELAFQRFDELVKAHHKYTLGYIRRGYVYETELNNYELALKDYLIACELGNSWAQNRVGWLFMMGVQKDFTKAEYFLKLAAKQNNKTAIENLAILKKMRESEAP